MNEHGHVGFQANMALHLPSQSLTQVSLNDRMANYLLLMSLVYVIDMELLG
jgi:hypothetical protein